MLMGIYLRSAPHPGPDHSAVLWQQGRRRCIDAGGGGRLAQRWQVRIRWRSRGDSRSHELVPLAPQQVTD
jgi:hypothetical protein